MRARGALYRVDGEARDPIDILRSAGFGIARLRIWHTPAEPWHGLDSTLVFARELSAAGFDLMLDIHYSDTWADPGHQAKPAAWEGLSFNVLADSVHSYTRNVVARFREAGALPRYVQTGNEITPGFLWDEGRVGWPGSEWDTRKQWKHFTELLDAAVDGVRDGAAPEEPPRVVLHVDSVGDIDTGRWFFDKVVAAGVDFDVIGVSFYPWWHGTLTDLIAALNDLATAYGKEIQVVETSYPWTLDNLDGTGNFVTSPGQLHTGYDASPEGQLRFLRDVAGAVQNVPGGIGRAVVYWEPAWVAVPGGPGNPHENLSLFDEDGDALPALFFTTPSREARGHDTNADSEGFQEAKD